MEHSSFKDRRQGLFSAAFALFAVTLVLCGCQRAQPKHEDDSVPVHGTYKIFYKSRAGTELVRESYTPEHEDFEGILRELLTAFQKPLKSDEVSALPAEVKINSTTIGISELDVDFSSEYLSLTSVDEVLLRAGLSRTLLQMPGVDMIRFTVDSQPLSKNGELIGPMTADTFIIPYGNAINSYRYIEIPLYFSNETGDKVVLEMRNIYYSTNLITERLVAEQIIDGPQNGNLQPVVDESVLVRSATIKNGICTIDFSASVNNVPAGSNAAPETVLYAFVNAICDACRDQGVTGVRFQIEGDSEVRFRSQVNLNQVFSRNGDLIEAISVENEGNAVIDIEAELPEEEVQRRLEPVSEAVSENRSENSIESGSESGN